VRLGRILGFFAQAFFGLLVAAFVVVFAGAGGLLCYVGAALVRFALLARFVVCHDGESDELRILSFELKIGNYK
jgi:hypothetical protein